MPTKPLEFRRAPSVVAFMARAFRPSPGLKNGVPPLTATWRGCRVEPARLADFQKLTALPADRHLSILYPQVVGFRLIMTMLTCPTFPLPIWRALQIRNRLRQHRALPLDAIFDLETRVGDHRVLQNGVEIDLHTALVSDRVLAWESTNTFYYRGPFGGGDAPSPHASAPEAGPREVARWRTSAATGWRGGRLTGDYNGIHLWNWYARLFGFRKAFHHPQIVLGQCLARLSRSDSPPLQELDAWLKGPVDYDCEVRLLANNGPEGTVFAIGMEHERRPAIIGRWRGALS